jgi:hypothetical protein
VASYMVDHLMSRPSIILQTIPVLRTRRLREFLDYRQDLAQLVVGDVSELCAVVFGDHELYDHTISPAPGSPVGISVGTHCMASAERLDVEESEDGGGLKQLEGWDLAWW